MKTFYIALAFYAMEPLQNPYNDTGLKDVERR